jgi:hypothetical protein
MKLKLGAVALLVAMLASCGHSSSPLSAKDLVGLEGAWARLNSVRAALNGYDRAVRPLFDEMQHPYGPKGKAAIRRASHALRVAYRRAAAARLPEAVEDEEERMKESMEAMFAAWRLYVPRLKSTLVGHKELSWDDGMVLVEDVQNALDHNLEVALYEVSLLSCEASGGSWDPDDGHCMT